MIKSVDNDTKIDNNQNREPKKITRRAALIILGTSAIVAIAALGSKLFKGIDLNQIKKTTLSTTEKIPTPESISKMPKRQPGEPLSAERFQELDGIKVYYDNSGIPTRSIEGNGLVTTFDRNELLKIQERVRKEGVRDIVKLFRIQKTSLFVPKEDSFKYSTEHPATVKLPEDILTDEDLSKRGIKIIQGSNGVSLHIRKGAFEKNSQLEKFTAEGINKLTIVLVPGFTLWSGFLKDPRYIKYIPYLPEENLSVEEFKKERLSSTLYYLKRAQEKIKTQMQQTSNPEKLNIDLRESKDILTTIQSLYKTYTDLYTDTDWIIEMNLFKRTIKGQFIRNGPDGEHIIYLAIGDIAKEELVNSVALTVNESGLFQILESPDTRTFDENDPKISNSFPDPNLFNINKSASLSDPNSYPVAEDSSTYTLQHELTHNRDFLEGGDFTNEYRTDINTLGIMQDAWKKWVKSGYKDNSSFNFVFINSKGEIILSKNESNAISS